MTQPIDYPLLNAAQTGDTAAAKKALKEGSSPWAQDLSGDHVIIVAARFGNEAMCSLLLSACEENGQDPLGDKLAHSFFDALNVAARKNHEKSALVLLNKGSSRALSDAEFSSTWTKGLDLVLEENCLFASGGVIGALIEAGANPNAIFQHPLRRPLHLCVDVGHPNPSAAKALLERGADPEGRDGHGATPMRVLITAKRTGWNLVSADSPEAINARLTASLLAQHGALPSTRANNGDSALSLATREGPDWLAAHLQELEALAERKTLSQQIPLASPRTKSPGL